MTRFPLLLRLKNTLLHGCTTFHLSTHLSLGDVSISRSTFAYVSEGRVWSGPRCPLPERRVVALDLLIHSIPSDCCSEVRDRFPQQVCVGLWAFWSYAWVRPWASGRAAVCPKGLNPFCRGEPSVCWWAGRVEGELWRPGAGTGRAADTWQQLHDKLPQTENAAWLWWKPEFLRQPVLSCMVRHSPQSSSCALLE